MKINLLKITLTISLLGILILLFLSNTLNPSQTNIGNITREQLNQKVQIQGEILDIRTYENSSFQIITIQDSTGEIDVTINNPISNLTKIKNLTIIGKVTEYESNLQVQADKLIQKVEVPVVSLNQY